LGTADFPGKDDVQFRSSLQNHFPPMRMISGKRNHPDDPRNPFEPSVMDAREIGQKS
jgi:hypothetical protein